MMENLDKIVDLVEVDWPSKRVLVVGDLMLDKYVWGDVERISPEAPVPVVRAAHNSEQPGGAANVAMNLAGLGASVTVMGFGGEDDDQARLKNLLELKSIEAVIVSVRDFPTISKLRILGGNQQILRLDTEGKLTPPREAYDALLRSALDRLEEADAVILSDYAKGVLSERVCREIISAARSRKIPVVVDPKTPNFERYRGATTICPNLRELSPRRRHSSMLDLEELFTVAEAMVSNLDLNYLTVTMSEKGIAVLREKSRVVAPAVARQVFDVSGAGDTVIAIIALCICCGLPIENAVQLANLGAGIVVGARLGLCRFRNLNCWLPCHQISGFTRARKYCPSNVSLLGLRHGGLSEKGLCLQMAVSISCTLVISHFLSERDKKATDSSSRSIVTARFAR